jgi:hypothetical protein
VLFLVLPLSSAAARTWYITPDGMGDAPTIPAGLDSAAVSDTVLVAAGTYTTEVSRDFEFSDPAESVTLTAGGFLAPGVSLVSEDGPGATTIAVSGGPNVHCLVAALGQGDAESRIVGFRLEGVSGATAVLAREMPETWWIHIEDCIVESVDGGEQAGGFWSVNAGRSRIVDCAFSDVVGGPTFTTRGSVGVAEHLPSPNRMEVLGCVFTNRGGIMARFGLRYLDVRNCTFEGNSQPCGIFSDAVHTTVEDCLFDHCLHHPVYMIRPGNSSGTVRRCTFLDGVGHSSIGSGAVYAIYVNTRTVEDCRFERCSGSTGAVELLSPSWEGFAYVRNNVFVDITSMWFGALHCRWTRGEITGNTFVRCHDLDPDPPGAAIRIWPLDPPGYAMDVHNNIFTESSGSPAVGIRDVGAVYESCNCYWLNEAGDTDGFTMDATSFVLDPLFCDAASGDYTIQSDSPCAPPGVTGCGLVGAFPVGCGPIATEPRSWGRIKSMFRGR